mgnify:CR=1 FL=1
MPTLTAVSPVPPQTEQAAQGLAWRDVPPLAVKLAIDLEDRYSGLQEALRALPSRGLFACWYGPETKEAVAVFSEKTGKSADIADIRHQYERSGIKVATSAACDHFQPPDSGAIDQPWIRVAYYPEMLAPLQLGRTKAAYSPFLRAIGEIGGYLPEGRYSWGVPGVPKHLQGMIASGLLGAGGGYVLGSLAERALPANWERGKLRRTLALLGAGMGAMPGLGAIGLNLKHDRPWHDDRLFDAPPDQLDRYLPGPQYRPNMPYLPPHERYKRGDDSGTEAPDRFANATEKLGGEPGGELVETIKAAFTQSQSGYELPPPIDVDRLNQDLWLDPRVRRTLPAEVAAAASGVVEGAWYDQQQRGAMRGRGGARLVYPADLARISAGMGSGYLSGALVGKALGALLGMPSETQDRLKQVGLWSGVVANVLPMLFR